MINNQHTFSVHKHLLNSIKIFQLNLRYAEKSKKQRMIDKCRIHMLMGYEKGMLSMWSESRRILAIWLFKCPFLSSTKSSRNNVDRY